MAHFVSSVLPVFGFGVLVGAIALLLNPSVFEQASANDSASTNLQQADWRKGSEEDQDSVLYAEGYDQSSFSNIVPPNAEILDEQGQVVNPGGTWKTLLSLKMQIKYNEVLDDIDYLPLFTPEIRSLDGKTIELEGYIIPHELSRTKDKGNMFMFSAYPAASCFFCGGAGPESIVEVYPIEGIAYSKDKVWIKGRLRLNDKDPLKMPYLLEQAKGK